MTAREGRRASPAIVSLLAAAPAVLSCRGAPPSFAEVAVLTADNFERFAPAGTASTFPIFGTDDAQETHRLLGSRRVSVDPVQEGGGVRFFTFRDPDGNRLETCELLGTTSV